ncbi:hypothetical protein ACLK1T_10230 [Escherichia coli]
MHHAKLLRRYGAAVVVMAFDEQGQADTAHGKSRFAVGRTKSSPKRLASARRYHLRPEHLRGRNRH